MRRPRYNWDDNIKMDFKEIVIYINVINGKNQVTVELVLLNPSAMTSVFHVDSWDFICSNIYAQQGPTHNLLSKALTWIQIRIFYFGFHQCSEDSHNYPPVYNILKFYDVVLSILILHHNVILIDSLHYARTCSTYTWHRETSAKNSNKLNKFLHSEVNL